MQRWSKVGMVTAVVAAAGLSGCGGGQREYFLSSLSLSRGAMDSAGPSLVSVRVSSNCNNCKDITVPTEICLEASWYGIVAQNAIVENARGVMHEALPAGLSATPLELKTVCLPETTPDEYAMTANVPAGNHVVSFRLFESDASKQVTGKQGAGNTFESGWFVTP